MNYIMIRADVFEGIPSMHSTYIVYLYIIHGIILYCPIVLPIYFYYFLILK